MVWKMFRRVILIAAVQQLLDRLSKAKFRAIRGSKKLRGLLGTKKSMTQKALKLKKVLHPKF
jgi:hypothetical protein